MLTRSVRPLLPFLLLLASLGLTPSAHAKYRYDSFGNLLSKSGPLAEVNLNRFSGKEYHPRSGLYYYGFRYYQPNLQRWLNQDPIGIAGGLNLYGFVHNDPINSVDLYGLVEPNFCGLFDDDRPEYVKQNNEEWEDYWGRLKAYNDFLSAMDPTAPGAYDAWKNAYGLFRPDAPPTAGYLSAEPSVGRLTTAGSVAIAAGSGLSRIKAKPTASSSTAATAGESSMAPNPKHMFKGEPAKPDCPPAKQAYRAVSKAEKEDIKDHGFRPEPDGKSMKDKWFSETREGAEEYTKLYSDLEDVVEAEVPLSVYEKSYKHPNIDQTGPGFAVPEQHLPQVKPK